ncbi:hypothetical protein BC628DRAFT_977496 [Trametes gibbosa]|nr:hypothetical protein BC628DRAFT_977496 [Trametes gibbosa]
MRNTSPTNPTSTSNRHRRASSAASDLAKSLGIDLEAVSMAEARKVMSEEHKILGFRPPTGSFAAEVQSIAAKHPDGKPGTAPRTRPRSRRSRARTPGASSRSATPPPGQTCLRRCSRPRCPRRRRSPPQSRSHPLPCE